ncbi:hypothetical protein IRJ41_025469, partial [Triplophysa rosa]
FPDSRPLLRMSHRQKPCWMGAETTGAVEQIYIPAGRNFLSGENAWISLTLTVQLVGTLMQHLSLFWHCFHSTSFTPPRVRISSGVYESSRVIYGSAPHHHLLCIAVCIPYVTPRIPE